LLADMLLFLAGGKGVSPPFGSCSNPSHFPKSSSSPAYCVSFSLTSSRPFPPFPSLTCLLKSPGLPSSKSSLRFKEFSSATFLSPVAPTTCIRNADSSLSGLRCYPSDSPLNTFFVSRAPRVTPPPPPVTGNISPVNTHRWLRSPCEISFGSFFRKNFFSRRFIYLSPASLPKRVDPP